MTQDEVIESHMKQLGATTEQFEAFPHLAQSLIKNMANTWLLFGRDLLAERANRIELEKQLKEALKV